ncbi:MAG: hypothetical protein ACRDHY_01015, partial [Anaerolineales bacterium]
YYSGFLASRREALNGRDQIAATGEIDAEFSNVAAAWRWAVANGRFDLVDPATYPLFCYLTFRARFFEADDLASVAINAVEQAGDAQADLLGGLLMHHFWVLSRLGRARESYSTFARVDALFADGREPRPGIGMDPRMAACVLQIGGGNYGAAAAAILPALEAAHARGDQPALAFAAWLAGVARLREANLERAELEPGRFGCRPSSDEHPALDDAARFGSLASRILESAGESWLRGYVEIERGLITKAFGDMEGAIEHFRTACDLRRSIGDAQGTASALIYLADTLIEMPHFEELAAIHAEARELFARIGDATGLSEVERFAGLMAVARDDFPAATEHFVRTIELSTEIGFANNVLSALRGLARVLSATGRVETAAVVNAFVAAHPAPTPFGRAGAEFDLAEARRTLGDEPVDRAQARAASMDVGAITELALKAIADPTPQGPAVSPLAKRGRRLLVA